MLLIPAPQVGAAFPGQNGKIAYTRGTNISTVNPDGTGETSFPAGTYPRSAPTWSAGGQKITAQLFKGCDPFTEDCRYDIATYNADGTSEQVVPLARGGMTPAWSPDGTKLVYRYDDTPIASEFDGVWTVKPDGTDNQKLDESNGTAGSIPMWSPDGTRIAGTVSAQCLTIDQGCTEFSIQSDGAVSWSPDGSRVALSRTVSGNRDVYVRQADGSLDRLTTNAASDSSPAWSPDGTRMAFISTR